MIGTTWEWCCDCMSMFFRVCVYRLGVTEHGDAVSHIQKACSVFTNNKKVLRRKGTFSVRKKGAGARAPPRVHLCTPLSVVMSSTQKKGWRAHSHRDNWSNNVKLLQFGTRFRHDRLRCPDTLSPCVGDTYLIKRLCCYTRFHLCIARAGLNHFKT